MPSARSLELSRQTSQAGNVFARCATFAAPLPHSSAVIRFAAKNDQEWWARQHELATSWDSDQNVTSVFGYAPALQVLATRTMRRRPIRHLLHSAKCPTTLSTCARQHALDIFALGIALCTPTCAQKFESKVRVSSKWPYTLMQNDSQMVFNRFPKWFLNVDKMMLKWCPTDVEMNSKWCSNDAQLISKWCPNVAQMMSKWCPNDVQMMSKWCPNALQMMSKWSPNGVQMVSKWCPNHAKMKSRWCANDVQTMSK